MPPERSSVADDAFAKQLRGHGPVGIATVLVILLIGNDFFLPIGALLVLVWAWRSHTPWRELGFVRPKSWILTAILGIVFGIAFKFLTKAVLMPLLGADPVNPAYHYLAGNRAALPRTIFSLIVAAGFGARELERTGVDGVFSFENAHDLFFPLVAAAPACSLDLMTNVAIAFPRSPTHLAHAAYDLTALAMIYLNLETRVAHLIFN